MTWRSTLSDMDLLHLYKKSVKADIDKYFIEIVFEEIKKRKMDYKNL